MHWNVANVVVLGLGLGAVAELPHQLVQGLSELEAALPDGTAITDGSVGRVSRQITRYSEVLRSSKAHHICETGSNGTRLSRPRAQC
jgi:hypothetical protein